jgi:hypothetical protein
MLFFQLANVHLESVCGTKSSVGVEPVLTLKPQNLSKHLLEQEEGVSLLKRKSSRHGQYHWLDGPVSHQSQ